MGFTATMKVLVVAATLLLVACSARSDSQFDFAESTGVFLAARLSEPLQQAAAEGDEDPEHEIFGSAVEAAVADVPLPDDIRRVASSSSGSHHSDGYASLHIEMVVIPIGDKPAFCIAFAADSTGQVVSAPADGDPFDSCSDVVPIRLTQP